MNLRNRKTEKNKETLRRLAQKDGNRFCFDCGTRGPLYVVTNYCILVCSTCSAAHRSLQNKVKGISMSEFTDEEMAGMAVGGNDRGERIWLSGFKGMRPRPGHDQSIFEFVSDVFDRARYKNSTEYRALQDDIDEALHPTEKKPAPAAAGSPLRPPPAPQEPARPAAVAEAPKPAQPKPEPVQPKQEPPQPPQPSAKPRDVFDDIFSAPAAAPAAPQPQPSANPVSGFFGGAPASQPPPQGFAPQGYPGGSSAGQAFPGQSGPVYGQPQSGSQGPSSPGSGKIRVLSVTTTAPDGTSSTVVPNFAQQPPPQQPPQQQPPQQRPSQQPQQWGVPSQPQQSWPPYQQQQAPWGQQPQQQQAPWGQQPQQQQYPPQQQQYPPQQPSPPQQQYAQQQYPQQQQQPQYPQQQQQYPPYPQQQQQQQQQQYPPYNSSNFGYNGGGAPAGTQNMNFFQSAPADPWASHGPVGAVQSPASTQQAKKPAFEDKAFASLDPFAK